MERIISIEYTLHGEQKIKKVILEISNSANDSDIRDIVSPILDSEAIISRII